MFGWTIWILILPLLFEFFHPTNNDSNNNSNTPLVERRTNNFKNLTKVLIKLKKKNFKYYNFNFL